MRSQLKLSALCRRETGNIEIAMNKVKGPDLDIQDDDQSTSLDRDTTGVVDPSICASTYPKLILFEYIQTTVE